VAARRSRAGRQTGCGCSFGCIHLRSAVSGRLPPDRAAAGQAGLAHPRTPGRTVGKRVGGSFWCFQQNRPQYLRVGRTDRNDNEAWSRFASRPAPLRANRLATAWRHPQCCGKGHNLAKQPTRRRSTAWEKSGRRSSPRAPARPPQGNRGQRPELRKCQCDWSGSCSDLIRDEEAVGSNPATPTSFKQVRALIHLVDRGPECFPGPLGSHLGADMEMRLPAPAGGTGGRPDTLGSGASLDSTALRSLGEAWAGSISNVQGTACWFCDDFRTEEQSGQAPGLMSASRTAGTSSCCLSSSTSTGWPTISPSGTRRARASSA